MRYRRLGRTGWNVSELGFGTWSWGGTDWGPLDVREARNAMTVALRSGCNLIDTAPAYGDGRAESLIGDILKSYGDHTVRIATKITPVIRRAHWQGRTSREVFPSNHIWQSVEESLERLGLQRIDLVQFHGWDDQWADEVEWQESIQDISTAGLVSAWGVSANRWAPESVVRTVRTGLIDCVQTDYNIFAQAAADVLLPLCAELDVGIVARVPFDEGSLTGTLRSGLIWCENDFRNRYFSTSNLAATLRRVAEVEADLPKNVNIAEAALQFVLNESSVSAVVAGMRSVQNVRSNVAACESLECSGDLLQLLAKYRWDRDWDTWLRS